MSLLSGYSFLVLRARKRILGSKFASVRYIMKNTKLLATVLVALGFATGATAGALGFTPRNN